MRFDCEDHTVSVFWCSDKDTEVGLKDVKHLVDVNPNRGAMSVLHEIELHGIVSSLWAQSVMEKDQVQVLVTPHSFEFLPVHVMVS